MLSVEIQLRRIHKLACIKIKVTYFVNLQILEIDAFLYTLFF